MNATPAYRPSAAIPSPVVPRLALSIREAAQSLGISERTLADCVKAGTAPPSFTVGRLRLFSVAAVESWLADRTRAAEMHRSDAPLDSDGEETPVNGAAVRATK